MRSSWKCVAACRWPFSICRRAARSSDTVRGGAPSAAGQAPTTASECRQSSRSRTFAGRNMVRVRRSHTKKEIWG